MHPIEHLRYLARADDPDPEWLLEEAAMALSALADDQPSLVMGCRQLVEHQPTCGPLWWLCAQVVTADDIGRVIETALGEFRDDPTELQVSMALADTEGTESPLIVTALMAAPQGALVPVFDPAVRRLGSAIDDGGAIWLIARVGSVVAGAIFDRAVHAGDVVPAGDLDHVGGAMLVPADKITRVIGPRGATGVTAQLGRCDAPVVSSLFKGH